MDLHADYHIYNILILISELTCHLVPTWMVWNVEETWQETRGRLPSRKRLWMNLEKRFDVVQGVWDVRISKDLIQYNGEINIYTKKTSHCLIRRSSTICTLVILWHMLAQSYNYYLPPVFENGGRYCFGVRRRLRRCFALYLGCY